MIPSETRLYAGAPGHEDQAQDDGRRFWLAKILEIDTNGIKLSNDTLHLIDAQA